MTKTFLRAGAAVLALCAAPLQAASILDHYGAGYSKAIDTPEASAVAFNWDTRTLMVTNDEEENDGSSRFGEYDLNGNKIATISIGGCLELGSA